LNRKIENRKENEKELSLLLAILTYDQFELCKEIRNDIVTTEKACV